MDSAGLMYVKRNNFSCLTANSGRQENKNWIIIICIYLCSFFAILKELHYNCFWNILSRGPHCGGV